MQNCLACLCFQIKASFKQWLVHIIKYKKWHLSPQQNKKVTKINVLAGQKRNWLMFVGGRVNSSCLLYTLQRMIYICIQHTAC